MAVVRWGRDSDVYVYKDVTCRKGEWMCCGCKIATAVLPRHRGLWSGSFSFIAESAEAMIAHLQDHAAIGHKVPKHAITRLRKEAPPPKYPVHLGKYPKGVARILGAQPACGTDFSAHFPDTSVKGRAHPRDEVTFNRKRVTCRHFRRLMRARKGSGGKNAQSRRSRSAG